MPDRITFKLSPPVTNEALRALRAAAWDDHSDTDFQPVLARSLVYVCAYRGGELVGFVNVATDGGQHAFLLDTTVHPHVQRQGVGTALVRQATDAARERGAVWLHVDYEPHLDGFYRACGFRLTLGGLIRLDEPR
jgi:GNAT superfamily N-acetyltransferase